MLDTEVMKAPRKEVWGRGIKMILEREPQTEFEEIGAVQFVATFKRKSFEAVSTEAKLETSVKTSEETPQKTSVKIIDAIRLNSNVTIPELAELTGVTERSVERNIQRLQLENRLRRVGPDKGGHWVVVKE